MTPQEISDYKRNWMPGYSVQVDVDSAEWGKNVCRRFYNRENWSFKPHTEPDDSHTFFFEDVEMAQQFYSEYVEHNANFYKCQIPQFLIDGQSADGDTA